MASPLWSAVHELSILSAWVAILFSFYVFISPFSMGWYSLSPFYGALYMGIINESPSNNTLLHYVSWFFFDMSFFNFGVIHDGIWVGGLCNYRYLCYGYYLDLVEGRAYEVDTLFHFLFSMSFHPTFTLLLFLFFFLFFFFFVGCWFLLAKRSTFLRYLSTSMPCAYLRDLDHLI